MYDIRMTNKFNIGDMVYVIYPCKDFVNETICPICNGTHKININGYEFPCVYCERDDYFRYTSIALQITDIVPPNFISGYFKYVLYCNNYTFPQELQDYVPECYLFLALEEAKAECDRINAELLEEIRYK